MSSTRIRFIFWLMTICIVAINAFQCYWLLTTFRLNRSQFKATVQEALFQVVERQQIARADALFGRNGVKPGAPDTPPSPPGGRMIVRKFQTGPGTQTRLYVRSEVGAEDTLASRISKMLVLGWSEGGQVDKPKLFKAYSQELQKHGIQAAFLLDTLRITPEPDGDNAFYIDTQTNLFAKSRQFKTFPVPVNPVKNLFVQATFETPFVYLFRKMGGLLGASFLLLILTTGCFVYMLRTILRQKRLAEVKNDFINNMTHELKTPIATVTAAVEALMHYGVTDDPEKTRNYLNISQNNLYRLSGLVEKVLNLAIEDKQDLRLSREQVNLSELLTDLTGNYRLKALKPVDFELHIPPDATIVVDKMHFENVLNNLIDNAIKYSYEQVQVVFEFTEKEAGWELAVRDNGIGIAKNYQEAVFDKFYRVPTGNLHAVKGFGLGLAYVRQIVEKHGGRISVASEPGKGSAFTLTFLFYA